MQLSVYRLSAVIHPSFVVTLLLLPHDDSTDNSVVTLNPVQVQLRYFEAKKHFKILSTPTVWYVLYTSVIYMCIFSSVQGTSPQSKYECIPY